MSSFWAQKLTTLKKNMCVHRAIKGKGMIILIYCKSFERSTKLKKEKMRLSDFKKYSVLKGFKLKRICLMYPTFQLQRGFLTFRIIHFLQFT